MLARRHHDAGLRDVEPPHLFYDRPQPIRGGFFNLAPFRFRRFGILDLLFRPVEKSKRNRDSISGHVAAGRDPAECKQQQLVTLITSFSRNSPA